MGLRTMLIFPGLIVMLAFIIVEAAAIPANAGQAGNVNFFGSGQNNAQTPTTYTCTSTKTACFPNGIPTNAIINCQTAANIIVGGNAANTFPCDLQDNCNNVPNINGIYCAYILFVIPTTTYMNAGLSVFIGSNGQVQLVNGASAQFSYGVLSPAALLVMLTVAVGVAALAGIAVFGSGENSESVHILFVEGLLLGFWAVLSAAEGFVLNNPSSGFAQINSATGIAVGTGLYLVLTLLYVVGATGAVTRGV